MSKSTLRSNSTDHVMLEKERVISKLLEYSEALLLNKYDRVRVKSIKNIK